MGAESFSLAPARWIWLGGERTLPGTFLLFRREFDLDEIPPAAGGWILADSRYRLWVNGRRVQWGPAPADPRHPEADPVDLRPTLQKGRNAIGIEALFYGTGDGTWPIGNPGLIARLSVGELALDTGSEGWRVHIDRARRPGRAKRAYFRALQEEFDSRLHPHGWSRPGFAEDGAWLVPRALSISPDQAPFADGYANYTELFCATSDTTTDVAPRSIPMMREEVVRASALIDRGTILWKSDPEDWFDYRLEGSFAITSRDERRGKADTIRLTETGGVFLTFEMPYGVVGWPQATIDAPEGTVVEFIVQESRDPGQPWLDSHYFTWSRWISRGVEEAVEPFEYEGFRYLQLHIRNAVPGITIRNVGVRRRQSAFPGTPLLTSDDPALQSVFDAGIRTIVNSAQDLVVDGMGRERQQYSGDVGHQLHAVRTLFGGVAVSRRFLTTFATGQLHSGVWLDCWPGTDRLARLSQRELGATEFGPLVDHSIGFVLDHYHHWMHTGDLSPIVDHWPRFERFFDYLRRASERDGLFPVEGLGIETVWIDHDAFRNQAEKRCATNLYLRHMLGAVCEMALAAAPAAHAGLQRWRDELMHEIERAFYRASVGTYVANPAEVDAGGEPRFDDRSLSHQLLISEPGTDPAALALLMGDDPRVGRSYPANMVWPFWALARHGQVAHVLDDLRTRWAAMTSVLENRTIGEMWEVQPGTIAQMSHCAVAPLVAAHAGILGLRPLAPGYSEYELSPALEGLNRFETVVHTPAGALRLSAVREGDEHAIIVTTPRYGRGRVLLPEGERPLRPGMQETFRVKL